MRIDGDALSVQELEVALKEEIDEASTWLPESIQLAAVADKVEELAGWIQTRTLGGFQPVPQQTVAAIKSSRGLRPLPIWSLSDMVVYRALVNRLLDVIDKPDRSSYSYESFLYRPAGFMSRNRYVLAADFSSCYQYIDHEILEQELIARTARFSTVRSITELLSQVSGKKYGLPQQSHSSDVLAEAYLDQIERSLLRRGLKVWRYNDDLRFSCQDWSAAVAALEHLEQLARDVGLTLNDAKTITYKRINYLHHLANTENLRKRVADEAGLPIAGLTDLEYDSDEDGDTLSEPNADAAVAVLCEWYRIAGKGSLIKGIDQNYYLAVLYVLRHALVHLAASDSDDSEGIDHALQLLRYERHLTPYVARYLKSRDAEAATEVQDGFTQLLEDDAYLTQWQSLWIFHSLGESRGFSEGANAPIRMNWVKKNLDDPRASEPVRAASAYVLAFHGEITAEELLSLYDRTTPIGRPTVVAAMGHLDNAGRGVRAAASEDILQSTVFDWVRRDAQ